MTNYYLKPDGSDAADGLSEANAWATFNNALDNLSAGDTLYMSPGVHIHDALKRDNVGGTAGSPIIFMGDPYGQYFDLPPAPTCLTNQVTDFSSGEIQDRLIYWEQDSKFFEFHNVVFMGGATNITHYSVSLGENAGAYGMDGIVFEDCMFLNRNQDGYLQQEFSISVNYGDGDTPAGDGIRFRRCYFDGGIFLQCDDNIVANFDIDCEIESCIFSGNARILNSGDTGTYNITGIRIINCSQVWSGEGTNKIFHIEFPRGGAASQVMHGSFAETGTVVQASVTGDTCIKVNYVEAIAGGTGVYSVGGGITGEWGNGAPFGSNEFSHDPMMGYEANWIFEKYFSFRPFLMWEPIHLFGLKNQAIGKGDPSEVPSLDYYSRPYDKNRESYVWAGIFNGDYGVEPWNSQQSTVTDPDGAWSNDALINENTVGEFASTATDGSISANYLKYAGAAVNLDASQVIHKVYVRPYLNLDGATNQVSMNFYTSGEAENLGTLDFLDDSGNYEVWEGSRWYPFQEVPAPAGGWTVATLQGLEVRIWQEGGGDCRIYSISIWIDSGDHDAGAARVQGPRAIEETIVNARPKSIKLVRGGMYQTTIPCVKDVPITVSASMYMDANYTGTKPSLEVFNIPGGVALQDDAMVGPVETWEYLSVTFAPTQNGLATLRIRSQCSSDDGNCYFENVQYS